MMWRTVSVLVCGAILAGCSHVPFHSKSHEYQNESNVVPPMHSTQTAQVKVGQDYFPVPPIANLALAKQQPSIVPPGSNLQRFANKPAAPAAPVNNKTALQTQNGSTTLSVNESLDQAWTDVPKVLAKTPYHILDQDRSTAAYYVLDTTATSGQITEKTPIYRMLLSPNGSATVVSLIDRNGKPADAQVDTRILSALGNNWG